jgi:methanethiol S-methyltransferase
MKKKLMFIYGLISYVIFLATFTYYIAFIEGVIVPKTIDTGVQSSTVKAILIDIIVLSVFALQHSIMARPAFKKWWTGIIHPAIERSTYVLLSSLAVILICWQWRPLNTVLWNFTGVTVSGILYGISVLGWIMVLLSTLMISHFELFGLKQVYDNLVSRRSTEVPFTVNIFYGFVRHPLMLGFMIAFWAAPVMTAGHLLFAVVNTVYIFMAVKFLEEKDLEKIHGEQYSQYKNRVPMFLPFTKTKRQEP